MPQRRDKELEQHWRSVLADLKKSGLTMAEFCSRRGLKPNTLCNWRRTLEQRDAESAKEDPPPKQRPSDQKRHQAKPNGEFPSSKDFVPLLLTDKPMLVTTDVPVLEITFKNGAVISVQERCSPILLATVMELMETSLV